jgi:hypothetical protein
MSLQNLFIVVGLAINLLVAIYIYRQVKVAEISNQQRVMPILGISVGPAVHSEIAADIESMRLEPVFGKKAKELIRIPVTILRIYAQFNIARNIYCQILKNSEPFIELEPKKSAIPPKDEIVVIYEEDISKIMENLHEGEEIEFVANFTYQSVLDGEYVCHYKLRTGKYLGQQYTDLDFSKYPWKK